MWCFYCKETRVSVWISFRFIIINLILTREGLHVMMFNANTTLKECRIDVNAINK